MKATFEKTMDILVKAYLNDTLEHGNCHACAVGNLIAAQNGLSYKRDYSDFQRWDGYIEPHWYQLVTPVKCDYGDIEIGTNQINQIGYSIQDTIRIENAFENSERGQNNDDWMFNGLMAVLDVLAEIHGIDLTVKKNYQEQLSAIYES